MTHYNRYTLLIAPSKTLKQPKDPLPYRLAQFTDKEANIRKILATYSKETLQTMMTLSVSLSDKVFEMYQNTYSKSQAIHTFTGSVFTHIQPKSIDWDQPKHDLRIACALYGILHPLDGITPYRLDLTMPFEIDLISYHRKDVTQALNDLNQPILNLASSEYTQLVLQEDLKVPWIDVKFIEANGSVKSTYAKIMRGKFIHALMTQDRAPHELQFEDYKLNDHASDTHALVFQRKD